MGGGSIGVCVALCSLFGLTQRVVRLSEQVNTDRDAPKQTHRKSSRGATVIDLDPLECKIKVIEGASETHWMGHRGLEENC